MVGLAVGEEICGPERIARNFRDSSIHNEEIAKAQGLRGPLVTGFDGVWPANALIEERLGERWLERGRLQTWFRRPVVHGDLIRATLRGAPADDEFALRYEVRNQLDEVVVEGGAGWSPESEAGPAPVAGASDEPSALRGLAVFELGATRETMLTFDAAGVAENCEQNEDANPDGERVPTCFLTLLTAAPSRDWQREHGYEAGMYGKIDIRVHRRLRRGGSYRHTATIVGLRRRGRLEFCDTEIRGSETEGDAAGELAYAVSATHVLPDPEGRD